MAASNKDSLSDYIAENMSNSIVLESLMLLNRKNSMANDYTVAEDKLAQWADSFVSDGVIEDKTWKKLAESKANFQMFQELVLRSEQTSYVNLETPQYLKNIIADRLESARNLNEKKGVVIRIKEGLQLVGAFIDNVFHLPEQSEAFAVRSAVDVAENNAGTLQFYSVHENDQKILYQMVQDGPGTVMLTVKLQDFRPLPKLMKIKKQERLIYSFPVKEDFAYFPQLSAGDYIAIRYDNLIMIMFCVS